MSSQQLSLCCEETSSVFPFSKNKANKQKHNKTHVKKEKEKKRLSLQPGPAELSGAGSPFRGEALLAGASRPSAAGTHLGQGSLAPRIWDLLRCALLPPGPRGEARGSPAEPCPAPAAEHPALPETSAPVLGVQPALGAARPRLGKGGGGLPGAGSPRSCSPLLPGGRGSAHRWAAERVGRAAWDERHADQEPSRWLPGVEGTGLQRGCFLKTGQYSYGVSLPGERCIRASL